MKTRTPVTTLCLLLLGLLCQATFAQDVVTSTAPGAPLTLSTFTSTPHGYAVTSTIVYGKRDLILIDPQLLLPEAQHVVDLIKGTGKHLTTIYSTHAHPDHFFGVAAILKAFPDAKYVAVSEVRERIKTAWPARHKFWLPTYGNELPGEEAILPEALKTEELELEGYKFPITKEQIGLDGAGNSFVYIPPIEAVVCGDIIFSSHLRPPADTAPVYATLDRLSALNPKIVVAGHQAKGTPNDPKVLSFIKEYIGAFKMAQLTSANAAELQAKMLKLYPTLGREDALEQAAQQAYKTTN